MQPTTLDPKELMAHVQLQTYLLVEPTVGFAMSLKATLQALKVPTNQIWMANKLSHAKTLIEQHRPTVLIAEFNWDDGTATELINLTEANFERSQRVVIITGHQATISKVAAASVEKIDSHLLKPYSIDTFRSQLLKSFIQKLTPTEYDKKLREAELKTSANDFAGAIEILEVAKLMSPQPTSAYFLKGTNLEALGQDEKAHAAYRRALTLEAHHYRTLTAMYHLQVRRNQFKEATDIARIIHSNFPVDSNLLASFFECATNCGNFEELKSLYEIYRTVDLRNETLNTAAQNSFFKAGLAQLSVEAFDQALEFFDHGIKISGRDFNYLENVITALLRANVVSQAETVLSKVEPKDMANPSFHRLSFLIDRKTLSNDELLNRGRELIFSGMGSPDIFRVVVELLAQAGKETLAESVINKAVESFPDLRAPLYEILNSHLPNQYPSIKHSA